MKKPLPVSRPAKVTNQSQDEKSMPWTLYLFIVVFSCILYGNTLSNKFALDDLYAITGNKFTQQGFSGIPSLLNTDFFAGYYGDQKVILTGGRYRPLSLISFAIEYQFFGENPGMNHFVNLLLYALTACLLLYLFRKLFRDKQWGKGWLSLPFVAVLLFLAHPVHTEVVANIKGRDEILSLLGSVVTAIFYLKFLEKNHWKYLIYCFVSFFLACMAKENAFLFIIIIPVTVFYFKDFNLKKNAIALTPVLLAGLFFFILRMKVVGGITNPPSTELLDNPFVDATFSQRYATIIFTLGLYIKLLFYPHPLTWDYYPYHIPLMSWNELAVILSLLFYLLIFVLAIAGIRKKSLLSYSIWVYLLSIFLVSNILFQVGVFMAERFLYLPSLAFSLFLAWLLVVKIAPAISAKKPSYVLIPVLCLVLLLFSMKTISRNRVWQDDFTLHTTDAETSVNSAKGNNIAGQWYAWAASQPVNAGNKDALFQKAFNLVSHAVAIHPTYQDAWFRLGNIIFDYKHDVDSTVSCYLQVLKMNPNEENVWKNITMVINSQDDNEKKIAGWEKLLKINPQRFEPNFYLANFYFEKEPLKSIAFAEKARLIKPNDPPNLRVLATGYLNQREFKKAMPVYDKYLELNPTDTFIMKTRKHLLEFLKHPY